jgi:hypothetical protein
MYITIKGERKSLQEGIDFERLRDGLVRRLGSMGADNIVVQNNIVSFNNRFWKVGSNTSIMSLVSSGTIIISTSDSEPQISFSYKVSIRGYIVLFLISISAGVLVSPFLFLGTLLIIIEFIFSINNVNAATKQMLKELLIED